MRLLVVNDDGPPSTVSPYLAPFVAALNKAGHETVVVIPDRPLSWIGKAHAVGKTLTATSWCPASLLPSATNDGLSKACDDLNCRKAENRLHHWLVIDGPPASCAQIGLFHCGFTPRDFDLVVSGPNHGRNAGAVYALSSGTVGGAMEAALCGRRAVALSFGSKEPQPDHIIHDACARAVSLIEDLQNTWHPGVEIYNVNLPMVEDISSRPIKYTTPAASRWEKGGLFAPIRPNLGKLAISRSYQFRWAPDNADIKRQAELSVAGEDLWTSVEGSIGITPLKANFTVVDVHET